MKREALRCMPVLIILYAVTVFFNTKFERSLLQEGEQDLVQRAFGGMREMVASWAYMKAEEYHHSGLPFMRAMEYHAGEESLLTERSSRGNEQEEAHHHAGEVSNDLYSRIYAHVKVTEDTHLNASQGKELLPWFYIEVKFDPHDIRGYVLGAYSLERLNKTSEALSFLKEGERNNPRSAQILTSLGDFFYSRNAYDDALGYLSRACALWHENKPPNITANQYERMDRFQAYELLGSIYEKRGAYPEAVKTYEELFLIEPGKALADKIVRIKAAR